jgi:hypothetical protein
MKPNIIMHRGNRKSTFGLIRNPMRMDRKHRAKPLIPIDALPVSPILKDFMKSATANSI